MSAHAQYNLTASDGTTPSAAVGQEINVKGATYKYIKASGALSAFGLAYIKVDGNTAQATAALLTTTRPTEVVIPQFALADGEYGYAACGPFGLREDGTTAFKVISKIAVVSVAMYGTATAGAVDDAVSAPIVQGLTLSAACVVDDTATACVATRKLTTTS